MRPRLILARALLALAAGASVLAGCSADGRPDADARVAVVAAFYPLQFVAERIGGDRIEVTSLTRPGAEPHDLELNPRDVAAVTEADLVVFLSGFQPAVDQVAADQADPNHVIDVADYADLTRSADGDPHFWLDPTRLATVARAVADRLAVVDPAGEETYAANAAALESDLTELDGQFLAGLARCRSRHLVTAHSAFGYLAERYDLEPAGIAGITPDVEPSTADLVEVSRFVTEHGVTTIFTEPLSSTALADTVARETGTRTAVLDPVEALTPESAGDDYLSVMRSNLAAIREGLGCR